MEIINKQSIIGIENSFYLSQTEDYSPGDTDSRSAWILFRWTAKCGRLIKAKTTKLHKLFVKSQDWSWQEVMVLVKQGLVGVKNGCLVTRGHLETIKVQLAASRYCFENSWWCPWEWYRSENSSSLRCRNMSEITSTMANSLHFECLNHSYSILIFKCILFFHG